MLKNVYLQWGGNASVSSVVGRICMDTLTMGRYPLYMVLNQFFKAAVVGKKSSSVFF